MQTRTVASGVAVFVAMALLFLPTAAGAQETADSLVAEGKIASEVEVRVDALEAGLAPLGLVATEPIGNKDTSASLDLNSELTLDVPVDTELIDGPSSVADNSWHFVHYGRIDPASEQDYFSLSGIAAGDRLTLRATRTGGRLDGWLGLFDPAWREVAFDDDSAGSFNPEIRFTASRGGTYNVRVSSYGWASTGDYRLDMWVSRSSGGGSSGCQTQRQASIMDGVSGDIERGGCDSWTFSGWAGRWVSIRARGTDNLDTVLRLYDPNGSQIAFNDDAFGYDLGSMVVAYLPSGGNYRLVVSGYGGTSSGHYRAHIGLNRKATVGDANSSCSVDEGDRWLVEHFIGTSSHNDETWHADVNLDGFVNAADYAYVLAHWGQRCR